MASPLSRRRLLVWGGGGHGKVVADLVRSCGHEVVGFVDGDEEKMGRSVEPGGAVVLVSEARLLESVAEGRDLPEGAEALALGLGRNSAREQALESIADSWQVPPLVHPSAVVSPSVKIGNGAVVLAGAVVNAAARIGDGVIVNSGAVIEHDCEVKAFAHVSPGAVLAGAVRVGERSWVGAGATVIQEIEIGADATVAAGAAVIRNVPSGSVVGGVPARPLGEV